MNTPKMKDSTVLLRLLSYIKPFWYLILLSTIGGIIKMTVPLVLPQVLKYFTDDVLPGAYPAEKKLNIIFSSLIFMLILYIVIYIPAAFLRNAGSIEVSNRVTHRMRCQVFDHLQKMSACFHHDNKSGDLVTRINNDVEQVRSFIWSVATNIWIDCIILLIYLSLMAVINLPLTLFAGVALPVSVLITTRIRKRIRTANANVQKNISIISGYMQERMAGYETIKLFNMENYESKGFEKHSKTIYKYMRSSNNFSALGEAVNGALSEIICAVIVCLSAYYIIKGKMSVGDLIVFYSYLGYFITPLRRFAELNVTYAKSIAGIERVFEILDTTPDIQQKPHAIQLTADSPLNLSFRNLFFKYEKDKPEYILENINFEIKEGETVALVGSSGCGKTTLAHLLTRFYDVDGGSILVGEYDLRDLSLESFYRQTGMVFQDTILFSGTIKENILYGKPDATMEEVVAAAKAANAYHFIMDTPEQFDTILGERGIGLSGGQKQRISIARVFLRNPRLLILDEATSALDSESEELVQEALDNLMSNRTSLVIAHRLSTIINADKIVVMDKGRILETGRHQELLEKDGRYAELYHMQFKDVLEKGVK